MKKVLGIDVGGSTTKICGFDGDKLLNPLFVKANDPAASVFGAFGKFLSENKIKLDDIEQIMLTGIGSNSVSADIYGHKTRLVSEFDSIGRGGLYLTGIEESIIVSMGTGTALVHAKNKKIDYLGGTGVGGGTLIGLSKKLLGIQSVGIISELASQGDLSQIDLRIGDITKKAISPTLTFETTAANFGKVNDIAGKADIALGILNLVFETIAMMAIFSAKSKNIKDIILTGNLTTIKQCKPLFEKTGQMFGFNFHIPDGAEYSTVIGSALTYFD